MVRRSDAIKDFLNKNAKPELAALYSVEMECQINIAQDNGQRIDKRYQGHSYHAYTDGVQTWKSFRIPLNSMTEPVDNDHQINFDLALHVEGIGLT